MAFGARRTLGYQPPRVVSQHPQLVTGSGRVATRTRAPIAAAAPAGPWTPPPIPVGAYNPIRDIEEQAGKRGLSNTLEDLGTREQRGDVNFGLGESEIERERGEQTTARDKALASLKQSYQRLGTRQEEQANGAGVLRGGALLQAAGKRAANEGKQVETTQQGYQTEMQADDRSLSKLALARQQEGEDNTTQGSRAEREQDQFGIDTQTLEAREAAENGYVSPTAPAITRAAARPPAVVGSHPQPRGRQPLAKRYRGF